MDLAQTLKDRWASMSERDQRALKLGAPLVLGILVVALFVTVFSESRAAVDRVEIKRAWLADLPAARDRSQRLQHSAQIQVCLWKVSYSASPLATVSSRPLIRRVILRSGCERRLSRSMPSSRCWPIWKPLRCRFGAPR